MPNDALQSLEEVYNNLVKSGTSSLRNVNAREQAKSALANAIGSALEKSMAGRPDAEKYKGEISKALAAAIVDSDALDETFHRVKDLVGDISDYLEKRLTIPMRMHGAADTVAGKNIPPQQLAVVQSAVSANALAARALDEKLQLKVKQDFSLKPSLVLDPTLSFVRSVDAAYSVTITQYDATVKLRTGFSLERPFTSSANLGLSAGVEVSRPGLTGYVRGSTQFADIYGRPTMTGARVGAGVQVNLAPRATLNLDYSMNNTRNQLQSHTDQSVFLGITIRF